MDDEHLSQAVGAIIQRTDGANRVATRLLHGGVTHDGMVGWDGGRIQTIHCIDWTHPERNEFTVFNQYREDSPQASGEIDDNEDNEPRFHYQSAISGDKWV